MIYLDTNNTNCSPWIVGSNAVNGNYMSHSTVLSFEISWHNITNPLYKLSILCDLVPENS